MCTFYLKHMHNPLSHKISDPLPPWTHIPTKINASICISLSASSSRIIRAFGFFVVVFSFISLFLERNYCNSLVISTMQFAPHWFSGAISAPKSSRSPSINGGPNCKDHFPTYTSGPSEWTIIIVAQQLMQMASSKCTQPTRRMPQ